MNSCLPKGHKREVKRKQVCSEFEFFSSIPFLRAATVTLSLIQTHMQYVRVTENVLNKKEEEKKSTPQTKPNQTKTKQKQR